jgi:hypothetical protein
MGMYSRRRTPRPCTSLNTLTLLILLSKLKLPLILLEYLPLPIQLSPIPSQNIPFRVDQSGNHLNPIIAHYVSYLLKAITYFHLFNHTLLPEDVTLVGGYAIKLSNSLPSP